MFNNIVDRTNTNCAKWDEAINQEKIDDLIPLTVADMDFRSSPEIINSLVEVANHGIYGYTNISEKYITSSISWIEKYHNWIPKKEWFVYCPRIIQAISMIIQNFTLKGDKVMVSTPLYSPIQKAIISNERELVNNDLLLIDNHYEIDFEDFEKKIKSGVKIYICVSPHNPTGRVWTKDEIKKIIEICKKYNVLIVADEVHADFIWRGKFTSFGYYLDSYDNIVICSSPSKTFNIPGLEASNIFIKNEKIRTKFSNILHNSGIHNPNYFSVFAVEAAYSSSSEWYYFLKQQLNKNINYVSDFFDNIKGLRVISAEGTFLQWIDYRELNITESELKSILLKSNILVNLGSEFGDSGLGFLRINIATPRKTLEKALNSLKHTLMEEGLL